MNSFLPTRREFLKLASGGFGATALAGLCNELSQAADNPLAAKSAHHAPKADRVIFLYSTGGVSQQLSTICGEPARMSLHSPHGPL